MPGIKQRFWGQRQFLSKKKKEEKKEDKKEDAVTDATTASSSVAAPVPLPDPPKRGRKRVTLEETELNPLALQLKRDWLQHKQTSKGVQQYAEAAASSGSSGMASLAAAATEGINPKNLARDMRRRLLPSTVENGPPLYWLDAGEGSQHPMVPSGPNQKKKQLKFEEKTWVLKSSWGTKVARF